MRIRLSYKQLITFSRVMRGVALLLMVWFLFKFFQPSWGGTGNSDWLIFIIAMILGVTATRINPRVKA